MQCKKASAGHPPDSRKARGAAARLSAPLLRKPVLVLKGEVEELHHGNPQLVLVAVGQVVVAHDGLLHGDEDVDEAGDQVRREGRVVELLLGRGPVPPPGAGGPKDGAVDHALHSKGPFFVPGTRWHHFKRASFALHVFAYPFRGQ